MQLCRYRQIAVFCVFSTRAFAASDASTVLYSNTSSASTVHIYRPTSTSSSTVGLGDYIASGLGLQNGSATIASTSLGVTTSSSSAPDTVAYNTSYSALASGSGVPSGTLATLSANATYTPLLNDTFNLTGSQSSCQASWNSYYATLEAWLMAENISTSFLLTTQTLTSTIYAVRHLRSSSEVRFD